MAGVGVGVAEEEGRETVDVVGGAGWVGHTLHAVQASPGEMQQGHMSPHRWHENSSAYMQCRASIGSTIQAARDVCTTVDNT